MSEPLRRLLADGPTAIALGVREFADAIRAQGGTVEEVAWRPPETVDPRIAKLAERLL